MTENQSNFYVIKFYIKPFEYIEELVCVPHSWIRGKLDSLAYVSYPVEPPDITKTRVRNQEAFSIHWNQYMAHVKYHADDYFMAANLIHILHLSDMPGTPMITGMNEILVNRSLASAKTLSTRNSTADIETRTSRSITEPIYQQHITLVVHPMCIRSDLYVEYNQEKYLDKTIEINVDPRTFSRTNRCINEELRNPTISGITQSAQEIQHSIAENLSLLPRIPELNDRSTQVNDANSPSSVKITKSTLQQRPTNPKQSSKLLKQSKENIQPECLPLAISSHLSLPQSKQKQNQPTTRPQELRKSIIVKIPLERLGLYETFINKSGNRKPKNYKSKILK